VDGVGDFTGNELVGKSGHAVLRHAYVRIRFPSRGRPNKDIRYTEL
jgi:hypothetical protein